MNNKTTKKLYFLDTSLPGDEGKYFKYILLSEKQRNKYINWFNSYDWKENSNAIYLYTGNFEYRYTKSLVLGALTKAKPITETQIQFLKDFCPGTRFDAFRELIKQHS